MTVKNLMDALNGIHFDLVLDAAPNEHGGSVQSKNRQTKSKRIKWLSLAACVVLCACLTPIVLNLFGVLPIFGSEVKLTGISGGNLSELPADVSEIKFVEKANYVQLRRPAGAPEFSDEDFQQPEDVDTTAQSTFSVINQTVVLFDENQYASITITLDNPNEYYICDFYMTCSQPDAMINVDGKWLPLDGSVKIRWTGSTNREATYTVYLPTVSGDTTVSITDMRYLNETEIAVDLAEHSVASVYRMETPVRTEFVVNTPEFFLFKVITTENCTSLTVEGATYDENEGAYKMTANGTYRITYTYSIPGTDLTGEGVIVSEEIELLKIRLNSAGVSDELKNIILYINLSDHSWDDFGPQDEMWKYYGATNFIGTLQLRGTGMTFHEPDPEDPLESHLPANFYICDANLTVSINGSEFAYGIYLEGQYDTAHERWGAIYNLHSSYPVDGSSIWQLIEGLNIELKWNGYTIYKGNGSDLETYDG